MALSEMAQNLTDPKIVHDLDRAFKWQPKAAALMVFFPTLEFACYR